MGKHNKLKGKIMSGNDNKVVPFGKYRGKPIETLAADVKYCEWLSGQDWFKEKYSNIYNTIIVNTIVEPQDSPEHNILQMKFLDNEYCLNVYSKAFNKIMNERQISDISFEYYGYDVYFKIKYKDCDGHGRYSEIHVVIEIKPSIGDDYPNVLRQMKGNIEKSTRRFNVDGITHYSSPLDRAEKILIIDKFNATNVTYDQVKQFFAMENIKLVTFAEIEHNGV